MYLAKHADNDGLVPLNAAADPRRRGESLAMRLGATPPEARILGRWLIEAIDSEMLTLHPKGLVIDGFVGWQALRQIDRWRRIHTREEGPFATLPIASRVLSTELVRRADDRGEIAGPFSDPHTFALYLSRSCSGRPDRRLLSDAVKALADEGFLRFRAGVARVKNFAVAQGQSSAQEVEGRVPSDGDVCQDESADCGGQSTDEVEIAPDTTRTPLPRREEAVAAPLGHRDDAIAAPLPRHEDAMRTPWAGRANATEAPHGDHWDAIGAVVSDGIRTTPQPSTPPPFTRLDLSKLDWTQRTLGSGSSPSPAFPDSSLGESRVIESLETVVAAKSMTAPVANHPAPATPPARQGVLGFIDDTPAIPPPSAGRTGPKRGKSKLQPIDDLPPTEGRALGVYRAITSCPEFAALFPCPARYARQADNLWPTIDVTHEFWSMVEWFTKAENAAKASEKRDGQAFARNWMRDKVEKQNRAKSFRPTSSPSIRAEVTPRGAIGEADPWAKVG